MPKRIESGLVGKVWITFHTDLKMEGFQSLSTSPLPNKFCQYRCGNGIGVCSKCYSERQMKYKVALNDHLEDNFHILQKLLEEEDIMSIKFSTPHGRFESFGDVASVEQAVNYLRIVYNNPNTFFGIWSKNTKEIWKEAFEIMGKPTNCNYVHSSLFFDTKDELDETEYWFVDFIFTVYTTEGKLFRAVCNGSILCNGEKCKECMVCYTKHTGRIRHIAELLRK